MSSIEPGALQRAVNEYKGGNFSLALAEAERFLPQADPAETEILLSLKANVHLRLGQKIEAAKAFIEAAHQAPGSAKDFLKFAVTLLVSEGRQADVVRIAAAAVAANPSDVPFLFKVAMACKTAGALVAAEPFIADLDLSKPAHFALFRDFEREIGDPTRFYRFLTAACAARPDNVFLNSIRYMRARGMSDFPALEALDAMLAEDSPWAQALMKHELALFRMIRTGDERAATRPCYETELWKGQAEQMRPPQRRPFAAAGETIRIGYLSSDFTPHATMTLFEEVMCSHDRNKFEIFIFCYSPDKGRLHQSTWPELLREKTVHVATMSDDEVAVAISERKIDILVDLKGHTSRARLGIVNRSDAPVKVTYLGFPGSVGGIDLDYAITDPVVTPDSSKPFYSEKLCRLPETYQANGSARRKRPLPLTRSDFGLPEDKLLLGSFNASHKIVYRMIKLWARIMASLPDACLCLLCKNEDAQENIRSAFANLGIDPRRLIFSTGEPYERYLTRISLTDLALDIAPYNGHTTSSDILWAGTPLVTVKGTSFASRVSESLLWALGLPELVAANDDDYCALAVKLGEDASARAEYRQRIADNRLTAPLFDTERFTRHLERAYEQMADRARRGLPPDHIDIEPLPIEQW
jgi:predicted O-linked N-acetylglucosamine transferase (SPINDLY family)